MTKLELLREVTELAKNNDVKTAEEDVYFKPINYTQRMVESIIDAYREVIVSTLSKNHEEKIPFMGLGNFRAKSYAEKSGSNILNGKKCTWTSPAYTKIVFKSTDSTKIFD